MEIAPDFFDYFEATSTLLDNDKYGPYYLLNMYERLISFGGLSFYFALTLSFIRYYWRTIMAVSSWNDNGQVQFVHDPG